MRNIRRAVQHEAFRSETTTEGCSVPIRIRGQKSGSSLPIGKPLVHTTVLALRVFPRSVEATRTLLVGHRRNDEVSAVRTCFDGCGFRVDLQQFEYRLLDHE